MVGETGCLSFESVFLQRGFRDDKVSEMTQHGTVSLPFPFYFLLSFLLLLYLLLPFPSLFPFLSRFLFLPFRKSQLLNPKRSGLIIQLSERLKKLWLFLSMSPAPMPPSKGSCRLQSEQGSLIFFTNAKTLYCHLFSFQKIKRLKNVFQAGWGFLSFLLLSSFFFLFKREFCFPQ